MKIISLYSENFKRLKAVEIKPDGNIVAITGKNGSGKTSVLDSIVAALAGGRALPAKAIRDGQESAEIRIDVGEYIVTRKITASGTTVKVETPDGFSKRSPQSFLDSVVGKISFDPMDFIRLDGKKKRALLAELVNLDLATFETRLQDLEGRRANLRSRFEAVENEFNPALVDEKPGVFEDPTELNERLATGNEVNSGILKAEGAVEQLRNKVAAAKDALEADENRLRELREEFARKEKNFVELIDARQKEICRLIEVGTAEADKVKAMKRVDMTETMNELNALREKNAKIAARNETIRRHGIAAAARDAIKTAEFELSKARKEQTDAIAAAKFPVPGLSFGAEGLLFNGIPDEQISDAEKIKVGIAISMAMNPTLRVIRLTDGSLLDSDSWKAIEKMAKDKDFQVWIEKVDESGKIGFFIEDGAVKN